MNELYYNDKGERRMTKEKEIIIWTCPNCKDVIISKNWEHHKMDYCKCERNACDFEQYGIRWLGDGVHRVRAKHWYVEELLADKMTEEQLRWLD